MKLVTTKLIAACAHSALVFTMLALQGCANMGTSIGIGIPIGGFGNIGVSVGSGGQIGASVGVGVGPAVVSVGTSGHLPTATKPEEAKKAEEATKH